MCNTHTHTQITFLILKCISGFHYLLIPPLNSQHMHMRGWKKKKAAGFIKYIYRISRTIRRAMIFLLDILEEHNDECILILVIYWKKT